MNHDSKHNDFEYEKETFPKTPEHFKQLVVNQVAQEQQKKNISPIKSKKKWMPAKVAAVIIVCATMGTTGAYAGIKQYQARSQQYLQETGRITTPESSSEEETSAASDTTDSVAPATIVSEESGLVTTFSDTWPDVMLELYDQDGKYQKLSTPYMNVIDAYYDGGLLSIYGEATEYGFFLTVLLSMIQFIWLPGTSTVSMVTKVIHNINAVHFMLQWNFPMQIFQTTVKYRFH